MQQQYDAIVIGSGLGGLTAAALYAHAGHRVLVLEQNDFYGGAATTYHRGSMTIEASLHETTDPRTTTDPKGEIFDALGLYQDIEFVPVDNFYQVRCPLIGAPLTIPHGLEALSACLSDRFPLQADAVRRFIKLVDNIQGAMHIFMEKHDGLWWLAHGAELPFRLWPVLRDMRASLSSVLERYFADDEAIKFALAANMPYYADDPEQMWWLAYAVAQGGYFAGGGNYIKGGSQVLSDRLVDRVTGEGGQVLTGQTVTGIQVDTHGAAAGVRYRPRNGDDEILVAAPVVFANASPHAIQQMLFTSQRDKFMEPYLDKPLSTSLFSITLGMKQRPLELGVSAYSTAIIPKWMEHLVDFRHCAQLLADMPSGRVPAMMVVDYSHIHSGLPEDELYPLNIVGVDRLANWEGLNDAEYHDRKNAWLDTIINTLEQEWAGFAAAVVQKDMATARTMHDYLHTPEGAVYGFAPHVPQHLSLTGPPRTPRTSIKGLYLASAYAGFGGFSGAMGAGGLAAKMALHDYMSSD